MKYNTKGRRFMGITNQGNLSLKDLLDMYGDIEFETLRELLYLNDRGWHLVKDSFGCYTVMDGIEELYAYDSYGNGEFGEETAKKVLEKVIRETSSKKISKMYITEEDFK